MSGAADRALEAPAQTDPLLQAGNVLDLGIIILDAELVVRGWNRWLEAASGRAAREVVGRDLLEVFPGPEGSRAEQPLRRALAGETIVLAHRLHEYLIPLPCPPGLEGYARMQQSARIVPAMEGDRITGVIAFVQDVTERVAREDELRKAKELAEAASQSKSDFLAAMSHELRTPLTAVIGYADLLAGEVSGTLGSAQKQQVARIRSSAWHLIGIIDEILTFSRMEAGKEEVVSDAFDAVELAREMVSMLRPQANDKGLTLGMCLPDVPVPMQTDARKLRQILLNLLGNAVKFTDEGEVRLEMDVRQENVVSFRVIDTGPGIAATQLGQIFDPFTQVNQSSTRSKGGTGLGLPVSRRLARLLGGEVRVESSPGQGSTFTLDLPIRMPEAPPT